MTVEGSTNPAPQPPVVPLVGDMPPDGKTPPVDSKPNPEGSTPNDGDKKPEGGDGGTTPPEPLETPELQAQVTELQTQVTTLTQERDTAITERDQAVEEKTQLQSKLDEMQSHVMSALEAEKAHLPEAQRKALEEKIPDPYEQYKQIQLNKSLGFWTTEPPPKGKVYHGKSGGSDQPKKPPTKIKEVASRVTKEYRTRKS